MKKKETAYWTEIYIRHDGEEAPKELDTIQMDLNQRLHEALQNFIKANPEYMKIFKIDIAMDWSSSTYEVE